MLPHKTLCDRVVVDHTEVSVQVLLLLEVDPVFDCAKVVTEMDEASGLDATENDFLNDFVCGCH